MPHQPASSEHPRPPNPSSPRSAQLVPKYSLLPLKKAPTPWKGGIFQKNRESESLDWLFLLEPLSPASCFPPSVSSRSPQGILEVQPSGAAAVPFAELGPSLDARKTAISRASPGEADSHLPGTHRCPRRTHRTSPCTQPEATSFCERRAMTPPQTPGLKRISAPQFLVGLYLQGSQVKRGFPPEAADKWGYRTFRNLGISLLQIDWSKTCMNHRGNEAESTPEV